jgi:hypothetical protein
MTALAVISRGNDDVLLYDTVGRLAIAWIAGLTLAVPSPWPIWLLVITTFWITFSPLSLRLLGLESWHPLDAADCIEFICGLSVYLSAMLKADRYGRCVRLQSSLPISRVTRRVSHLNLVYSADRPRRKGTFFVAVDQPPAAPEKLSRPSLRLIPAEGSLDRPYGRRQSSV